MATPYGDDFDSDEITDSEEDLEVEEEDAARSDEPEEVDPPLESINESLRSQGQANIEADMSVSGFLAKVTHDQPKIPQHQLIDKSSDKLKGIQNDGQSKPPISDISKHCPPGVIAMKTFQRTLRKTIFEGEFTGELLLLFIGRTGEGKSSLINSMIELNKIIAPEGASTDICTTGLHVYTNSEIIPGVTVSLVDTPGLQDTLGNEQTYIQQMKEQCSQVNLILYCMDMTKRRLINDDKLAMQKLYQAFGPKFWERVVIVLTFANNENCEITDERDKEVQEPPFDDKEAWNNLKNERFVGRVKHIEKHIKMFMKSHVFRECDSKIADSIRFIPAGCYKPTPSQPDPYLLFKSQNWLVDLTQSCCSEMKEKHKFSKLSLNDKIHLAIVIDNNTENEKLELINDQGKATKESLEKLGFCVLYFNFLTSHCIVQLLDSFKHVNHSQIQTTALIIFSKGNTRHVFGTDNEVVTFEDIFSHFKEIPQEITKLFFFHLAHEGEQITNRLDFNLGIPKNSIALAVSFNLSTKNSPAISSFIENIENGSRQLKQYFERIKNQCSKLPAAECECLDSLQDNFILPFLTDNDKINYTEKELDVCRSLWYKIRCETVDVLFKNKENVVKVVRGERIANIAFSSLNVLGGGLVAGGLILAPFTFGVSLSVSCAGGVLTGVGATGNFATHIYSLYDNNKSLKKGEQQIKMDQQLSFSLSALVAKYNEVIKVHKLTVFVSGLQATVGAVGAARFGVVLARTTAEEGILVAKTAGRLVGFAVAAVTIPVDIGLIIYNCYLLQKGSDNQVINGFIKQIEDSLKGLFTKIDTEEHKFSELDVRVTDKECGYTIGLPPSIHKENLPTITVSTILSGPFQLPPGTILVSAIYDVKIDKELKEPIIMEIDHCVDELDPSKMTFAIGTANIDKKMFEFNTLKDGDFHDDKGSIKLKESCLLCILYHDTESLEIKYAAQCSYTKGHQNHWKMKCTFSKYLNAHIQFARQYGNTEIYSFKFNTRSAPAMKLKESFTCKYQIEKWSISSKHIPDEVSKDELDLLEINNAENLLNHIIPSMELDIIRTDETASDKLRLKVRVKGSTLRLFIACQK